jgi:hypothetical protein
MNTYIAFSDEKRAFAFEKYLKSASGRAFAKGGVMRGKLLLFFKSTQLTLPSPKPTWRIELLPAFLLRLGRLHEPCERSRHFGRDISN